MDEELAKLIAEARGAKKTVGLVQGSWDMFHLGHLCYLQEARKTCDFLVVAMDDDEKIRHRKGSNRPIIPLDERYQTIKRLNIADAIVVKTLKEPHWGLIKTLQPDVLVVIKENYSDEEVKALEEICGRVAVLPRQATTSTSEIIRRTLIANGVKVLMERDARVANAVDEMKERVGNWEKLPEPWPQMLEFAKNSADWITPTAAACKIDGEWRMGTNKFDQGIPAKDIEERSELMYSTTEHAEINLLKKIKGADLAGVPVYITLFPCDICIKTLIDKNVTEIYYLEDHPERGWSKRSHERAEKAGIKTIQVSVDENGKVRERVDGQEEISLEESNRKYGKFKYIDPRNAREQNQLDVMVEFEQKGEDPLAPENVDTEKQEILLKTKNWYVVENRYPYKEIYKHLVIFALGEIYHIEDVTDEMWMELKEIWRDLRKKYKLEGGAFCFRFGDTLRSGASLKRVHAHIIVPEPGKKTKFAIGCDRLGIKDGLNYCDIMDEKEKK